MKLNHILALAAFLALGTAVTYATPVCQAGASLSVYTAAGFTCEVGDKIFTGFSYTATGLDPTAAQVSVGIDNFANPLTDIWQIGFQLGSSVTGLAWTSGFSLDYTWSIDQAACAAEFGAGHTCSAYEAQGQFQDGSANSTNTATMTDKLTPGGTLNLNDLTTGANTGQIFFSFINSPISVTLTAAGLNTTNAIEGFGLDSYQYGNAPLPEPGTLGLVGGALLGLGLLRRKIVSRP